jgi:thiamine-phosphate pyrophosphorylase
MARAPDLRLIVITDARLAAPRSLVEVVGAALVAGAPAVQLRLKDAAPRDMVALGLELRRLTREADALLFVNDRLDVALVIGADGVHLGPDDLPVAAARAMAPPDLLVGYSCDHPEVARRAVRDGASYIGCGAVFGTSSKDVGGERIGAQRLDAVARAVDVPVIGIGGIDPTNIGEVALTRAAGVAVIGAVMAAADPAAATRALLAGIASAGTSDREE